MRKLRLAFRSLKLEERKSSKPSKMENLICTQNMKALNLVHKHVVTETVGNDLIK